MTEVRDEIAQGRLARTGLLDNEAVDAAAELSCRVSDSGLETVRFLFADQHGVLRGKTVVADAIASVFCSGLSVPSTLLLKDTSNRTVFPVWSASADIMMKMVGAEDVLLIPEPSTFRTLPWSPHSAWIFCDTCRKSGETIPFSPRVVLKKAVAALADRGIEMVMGLEVEFHVFEVVDWRLDHASATLPGRPVVTRNLSHGYQLLSETCYNALEQVMDELRQNCQTLGLPIRSTEVEMGPSQFEFTFDPSDPLTHADNMMMFRTMAKEVCARNELHATFMCRPNVENAAASGWHLHQSLVDATSRTNLMIPSADEKISKTASAWIAGLLEHARESCVLTTPTVNGYKRYRPHHLAPDRIQWARDNRGAMIRALMAPGDQASRIENRVAESAANPYYCFASQILSGLDGIARGLRAPNPVETPYEGSAKALPESLLSAIRYFEASGFYRKELGDTFVDYLARIRKAEWNRYRLTVSDWEQSEYFGLY